jgi:hypothetical protein
VRINVDAQAFITREHAITEAVSQAMLAVTRLRHLPPDQEHEPSRRSCVLDRVQRARGGDPGATSKLTAGVRLLLAGLLEELDHYQARVFGP